MDLLGDLFVLGLILLSVWTFIPKHVLEAARSGFGPTVHAMADVLRQVGRAGERVTYRVVVGHDRPTHNLSTSAEPASIAPTLPSLQQTPKQPFPPIATPCNDPTEPLPVAQHEVDQAVIRAIARLITDSEKKPHYQGKIGETRAIELLFECKRSSDESSVYQVVRRSLKAELEKLRKPVYREG